MSEQLDSYLASVGVDLGRKQIDVNQAMQMLSAPAIIDHVDGSNVQQLIRVSLLTMRMDPDSAMIAEVGVLLSMIKPALEIDFGLQVGVANAQSCALFAMHSISLQQGNLPAASAVMQSMIPALRAAGDVKGLLEVFCWLGVLSNELEDYVNAEAAFLEAIDLIGETETAEAILDNSALDMVRADNRNIFSFPVLKILKSYQCSDIAAALRDELNSLKGKRHS